MIILDTDALSIQQYSRSDEATALDARIALLPRDEEVATTIISYEEQTRGWFAYLARSRTRNDKIRAYARLLNHVVRWKEINVLPFGEREMLQYEKLVAQRLRVGTCDLKIAAIAIKNNALLISRNRSDFTKIPNLRVEDWTRP